MGRLAQHPKLAEELDVTMERMIAAQDISVYQFESKADDTIVTNLPWDDKDGFVARTFIDPLNRFLDETLEITEED
jgi:hypothetical protein